MSCNAKVVECNADLFTSPFDRIVIFSYQIPYISSLFQPQDPTFVTYTERLWDEWKDKTIYLDVLQYIKWLEISFCLVRFIIRN